MSDKVDPYSLKYSINYRIGAGKPIQAARKPKMLAIGCVPDDNTVLVDRLDQRGAFFNKTGNFELPAFDEVEREDLILGGLAPGEPKFSPPDFAFNRICDPDSNSRGLELAQRIVEENRIPTLNIPERVMGTRRDKLHQRFANFEGVVVPKTVRLAPRYCREVRAFLQRGEVTLPCVFRPAGGHNSKGVFLIRVPDDTDELERFAFDGRHYYVSELQDCQDEDGLYRKFRMVYVDGRLYPRHLFVSDDWCVGVASKLQEQKYFDEEEGFLREPVSYLGEAALARLTRFCAELGLDFFGFDANLRPDGTLVVFEANACMNMFSFMHRDYMEPSVENIRKATKNMMMRFYQAAKASD